MKTAIVYAATRKLTDKHEHICPTVCDHANRELHTLPAADDLSIWVRMEVLPDSKRAANPMPGEVVLNTMSLCSRKRQRKT